MKRLTRFLPDSLFGLILLILAVWFFVSQYIFCHNVWSIQHLYIGEILGAGRDYAASASLALSMMDAEERENFIARVSESGKAGEKRFRLRISDAPAWRSGKHYKSLRMKQTLSEIFGAAGMDSPRIRVRMLREEDMDAPTGCDARDFPLLQTAVRMDDGSWIEIIQPISVTDELLIWRQRIIILLETLLFSLAVIMLVRRAVKPIERLAQEAERFGRCPETSSPIEESGSREVREAAQSFNRMRSRICGSLSERNAMLEAMGHDLRTPLARIQLRQERIEPEALREKITADTDEIRSIVEQGLELARSMRATEEPVTLDVRAFAESIVDDMREGGSDVSLSEAPDDAPLLVHARPTCLRRSLENLLTNAVKYAGSAEVGIISEKNSAVIRVDDSGPGIPDALLEKVFEPYYRLERSRSRESGGTGLGLAIARNMVLLDGGELTLRNRPEGGLSAAITLPSAEPSRRN